MKAEVLNKIKQKIYALTTSPGVYKMIDASGNIIYIGKAKNLKNRVSSYFVQTRKAEKVEQMVEHVFDFDYIVVNNEQEALNLESNLIHKHQPFYNILLKDGKAFPYIKINKKDKYPKVELTRRVKKDGAEYYGPYFGAANGTQILKIISNTFKLKDCNINKIQKRACLRYQMGYCLAPCIGACTPQEYRQELNRVVQFLKGDVAEAREILTNKMTECAKAENFEKALEYRDNLKVLDGLEKTFVTELGVLTDIDIFGFATNGNASVVTVGTVRGGKLLGVNNYNVIDASLDEVDVLRHFIMQYYMASPVVPEIIVSSFYDTDLNLWLDNMRGKKVDFVFAQKGAKKKLLDLCIMNAKEDMVKALSKQQKYEQKTLGAMQELQKVLKLPQLPNRIEGYDISNIQGTNTVSSMVVFTGGMPNKAHYRKFKIARNTPNDFMSMQETIQRRFNEYAAAKDVSFSAMPDLILIDGGKIQLRFAYEVLQGLDIKCNIVSLAKRYEEIYTPFSDDPIVLPRSSNALKLLQNVRDESHRFAITFHKKLRFKRTLTSQLQEIDGIGKTSAIKLQTTFKSINKIKEANVGDLIRVAGISKAQAHAVYNYFHKE